MNRVLLRSSAFVRAARRFIKKNPQSSAEIRSALELLSADPLHPRLKSHKLRGDLEGSWACSAGYDLRLVFKFVEYKGAEAILLESIGTHDEVY
ncbi:MAG TPA: type II toxin-antitoxin system mRNA interferase toxin, RelE/StbE family [Terriglobia bacterium]|nr:type II toxin-antitoxin system mRNA interferase toxin, RelE/StbE family [Terriglobia bacterium]